MSISLPWRSACRHTATRADRWFFHIFLGLWSLCLLLVAWVTPPFMVPDEPSHVFRAYQIGHGEWVGTRFGEASGGSVDAALGRLLSAFIEFIPADAAPVTADRSAAARAIAWSDARLDADFRNTVQYGPAFYLPQALALRLSEVLGLSLLDSFYLARAAAMAMTFAIGALALAWTRSLRPILAVTLLLPTSLFLCMSASQDGQLIAAGALFAAIITTPLETGRSLGIGRYILAVLCLVAISMARPPYAALSFIFLSSPLRTVRLGNREVARGWVPLAVMGTVAGSAVLWLAVTASSRANLYPLHDKIVDPTEQLRLLVDQPTTIWHVAVTTLRTMSRDYAETAIGVLGWLNIVLAHWAYRLAMAVVVAALLLSCVGSPVMRLKDTGLVGLALGLAVGGIFLGQYLTWTAVGAPVVDGVQGRYFLPLLGLAPFLLPLPATLRWRPAAIIVLGLLLLPLLAVDSNMLAVLRARYLGI